ncbi:hypothetical protein G7046_g7682 [Stylonectria norvegica]|nr:hypothetical protein G7046_g7682 [Stylonectria norvegica]
MAGSARNFKASANQPASATVFDFTCLFTHDLKKKQKKWQDGLLKYHTFNKRIMVHDDRGHFIGDAHWQAEVDLGEGDEFELDRGSAIVQVSECTGQREQDLSELLDKRAQDVERRRANAASAHSRTPVSTSSTTTPMRQDQSAHFQLRHRPLSSIVGTPPRLGRAVIPLHSPFEARQMTRNTAESRPAKRRKLDLSPSSKPSHARSLFGATLTLSAQPVSTPSTWTQALQDRTNIEPRVQANGPRKTQDRIRVSTNGCAEPSPQSSAETQQPSITSTKEVSDPSRNVQRVAKAPALSTLPPHQMGRTLLLGSKGSTSAEEPEFPSEVRADVFDKAAPSLRGKQLEKPSLHAPRESRQRPNATKPAKKARLKDAIDGGRDESPVVVTKTANPDSEMGLVSNATNTTPDVELRTALRIKSRQKRGLLMVSEKHRRVSASAQKAHYPELSQASDHAAQINENELSEKEHSCRRGTSLQRENSRDTGSEGLFTPLDDVTPRIEGQVIADEAAATQEANLDDDDRFAQWIAKEAQTQCTGDASRPLEGAGENEVTVAMDNQDVAACHSPPRQDELDWIEELSDAPSDQEPKPSPPLPIDRPRRIKNTIKASNQRSNAGPRITKMARKSVKSREIIGFEVQGDELIFTGASATETETGQVGYRKHEDSGVTIVASELHKDDTQGLSKESPCIPKATLPEANTTALDVREEMPLPKLSNPATRGKKAAEREHAAGLPPQSIVQLEPAASVQSRAPKLKLPAKESSLPSFSRANGGAWSRHAEDLLGMKRPAERPSRRR